jgi:hypothetical protein
MNLAIFRKLLITGDGVHGAILVQPFADLYCEDFATDLDQATQDLRRPRKTNRRPLSEPGGWNDSRMARPRGFEPLTFGSVEGSRHRPDRPS